MSVLAQAPARPFQVGDKVTVTRHMTWAEQDIHGYAGKIDSDHGRGQGGHQLLGVEIKVGGKVRLVPLYGHEIRLADAP